MWTILKGALGGIWGYAAAALAAVLGVLAVLASAKRAGKSEAQADAAKKELENVRKAGDVEREVATAKPDAVRKRLRKFQRD